MAYVVRVKPVLFVAGLVMVVLASVLWAHLGSMLVAGAHRGLTLDNDSYLRVWAFKDSSIYMQIYMFNITNYMDVVEGKKAIVEEIGPFTYRTVKTRIGTRKNGNKTISSAFQVYYYFDRSRSKMSEDVRICQLNTPFVVFYDKFDSFILKQIASWIDSQFHCHSARSWLFDGYPSTLLENGVMFDPSLAKYNGVFSYFGQGNNSMSETLTVFTGEDDPNLVNRVDRWGGMAEFPQWKEGSVCSTFRYSTDGFVAKLNQDRSYDLFLPQMCRTFKMRPSPDRPDFAQSGLITGIFLPLVKYELDPNTFRSALEYEANKCFTSDVKWGLIEASLDPNFFTKQGDVRYPKSGVYDLSECFGAPVFISNPHFLDADPFYAAFVEGMKPDKAKSTYTYLLEILSATVRVSYAFQVNLLVANSPTAAPNGLYPVLYQRASVELSREFVNDLFNLLEATVCAISLVFLIIILVGFILIVRSLRFLAKNSKGSKRKAKRG